MTDYAHYLTFRHALEEVLLKPSTLAQVELMLLELVALRRRHGRLFCLGVGGGAANAAHAVNDFRKLCGIEVYAPTDGISELTARANDEGWRTVFVEWLRISRLNAEDAIMVFSVGGGTENVSACIHEAVVHAESVNAVVLGVVGKPDGTTARRGDAVVVTGLEGPLLTPITETAQIAILHALVSDPRLQMVSTKW